MGQASEDERILRRGYSFHDGLAADYFPHYAIVAWIADVEVHRTERYI
jgi:hypothetical protein